MTCAGPEQGLDPIMEIQNAFLVQLHPRLIGHLKDNQITMQLIARRGGDQQVLEEVGWDEHAPSNESAMSCASCSKEIDHAINSVSKMIPMSPGFDVLRNKQVDVKITFTDLHNNIIAERKI